MDWAMERPRHRRQAIRNISHNSFEIHLILSMKSHKRAISAHKNEKALPKPCKARPDFCITSRVTSLLLSLSPFYWHGFISYVLLLSNIYEVFYLRLVGGIIELRGV